MNTFKLILEYDGTDFSGWQLQPGERTVQGVLEKGLKQISGQKIRVTGASRTDAGVHALGQVVHFRASLKMPLNRLRHSLNAVLPEDLSVLKVTLAPSDFHAIRSARKKTYIYSIWNSPVRPVLARKTTWHLWQDLDLKKMREAASFLKGRHNFLAFEGTKASSQTKEREIYSIKIRSGQPIQIEFTANGFLKYMVRNMVGTLVDVGLGKWNPQEIQRILHSRNRQQAGRTAPAQGLFLKKVFY
ncbi:MAG: tRNA pseudouridine(38-40) synthase TruA [bacterium]|nr:tRNA pseudouridine(38-40) synthase TruA [bacterium]